MSSIPPRREADPTPAEAEPARTPDGDRVAFDPAGRPPPGDLSRTARRFLVIAGLGLAIVLIWLLRDLIIVLLLAALVAGGMYGVVRPLERHVPRLAAIGLAYAGLIAVLVGLGLLIVPPLVDQAAELFEQLPALVDELRQRATGLVDRVGGSGTGDRLFDQLMPAVEDQADERVFTLPFTILQVVTNAAVMLFLSALLILERDAIRRWAARFLVARDRRPALDLAEAATTKLGAYVRGQLLVMVITGVGTSIGMMLLGVPFALPMGVLGFLAEAIPLAGPIIAGVPVLVLAFLESPTTGLLMFVWLLVLQQLEGWLIYPVVQGKILSLSPLVVVLAVLAGATLYGVLGAVIAVPIVAIIDVVLREVVFPIRQRASREDARAAREAGLPGPEAGRRPARSEG
ncbi:MAG TPA: AI-2E family transporter [Candidatus Limnocylindrales bacterium]|nr:AI-2E family transporter [Candidatus Limnocylindrales bacterium]